MGGDVEVRRIHTFGVAEFVGGKWGIVMGKSENWTRAEPGVTPLFV